MFSCCCGHRQHQCICVMKTNLCISVLAPSLLHVVRNQLKLLFYGLDARHVVQHEWHGDTKHKWSPVDPWHRLVHEYLVAAHVPVCKEARLVHVDLCKKASPRVSCVSEA